MREYIQRKQTITNQVESKASRQVSATEVLQAYKKKIVQMQGREEEELLQDKFETAQKEETENKAVQNRKIYPTPIIQLKPDHLFNNIPSAFSRDIPKPYIERLRPIAEVLTLIRKEWIADNIHSKGAIDTNSQQYSNALAYFRDCAEIFGLPDSEISDSEIHFLRLSIGNLFYNSIDPDVKTHFDERGGSNELVNIAVKNWLSQKYKVIDAFNR